MSKVIPLEYFKFRLEFSNMEYPELMLVWADQFEKDYPWKDKPVQKYKLKALFESIKSRSKNAVVKEFVTEQTKTMNFGDI